MTRPESIGRASRRRLLQWVAVSVVGLLWAIYLWRIWGQLAGYTWQVDARFLGAALLGWAAYFVMLAVGWVLLVRQAGQPLPLGIGVRIWSYSMPARYIPGNVWHVVGRVYLGSRQGIAAGVVLVASAVEQVLTVLGALAVSLPFGLAEVSSSLGIGLLFSTVVSLVAIHPRVLRTLLGWSARLLRKPALNLDLTYRGIVLALGWYVLTNLVSGISFWLVVTALRAGHPPDLPRMVGAYALAYTIGYLSFLTPGGLGAREAALVVLIGGLVPGPVAVGASLLARGLSLLAELLCVLAMGLWSAALGRRARHAKLKSVERVISSSEGAGRG